MVAAEVMRLPLPEPDDAHPLDWYPEDSEQIGLPGAGATAAHVDTTQGARASGSPCNLRELLKCSFRGAEVGQSESGVN